MINGVCSRKGRLKPALRVICRKKPMGKGIAYFLTGLVFIFLLACTRQSQYIDTVSPTENPYLLQVDTFSGDFVVYREDSFSTSSSSFAILGYHKDPMIGSFYCEYYNRFQLPVELPEIPNSARFDSIELILKTNDAWYGDSSKTFSIRVNRLVSDISSEDNVFYNTARIQASVQTLGNSQVRLRPQADDSLRILLDPAFGNELFQHIKNKSAEISTEAKFLEYFKGLRLSVDSTVTDIIIGLQHAISMKLHYHEDDGNIQRKEISFLPDDAPYHFNYIRRNFLGSRLEAMGSSKEVNASGMSHAFFLQEFTGIRTRIGFTGVKEILKQASYVKVLNAQLEIKPLNNSYAHYSLPSSIHLYQQKSDQTLQGPLTNADGSTQNGSLSIDRLYGKNTRYVYDVTDFVNSELSANNFTTTRLVLAIDGSDSTLTRLAGNSTAAPELRSRLIVSMLIYQKQ